MDCDQETGQEDRNGGDNGMSDGALDDADLSGAFNSEIVCKEHGKSVRFILVNIMCPWLLFFKGKVKLHNEIMDIIFSNFHNSCLNLPEQDNASIAQMPQHECLCYRGTDT